MTTKEIENAITYLVANVEEPKQKPWLKTALVAHLKNTFKVPEKEAEKAVNDFYTQGCTSQ